MRLTKFLIVGLMSIAPIFSAYAANELYYETHDSWHELYTTTGYSSNQYAFRFYVDEAFTLSELGMYAKNPDSSTGYFFCRIAEDDNGSRGTVLDTSSAMQWASISTGGGWIYFESLTSSLSADTYYWIWCYFGSGAKDKVQIAYDSASGDTNAVSYYGYSDLADSLSGDFAFRMNYESVPVCGNGSIEGTEACDDGDTDNGDGCSEVCSIEPGWSCDGEPSTCGEDITCWQDCYQADPPISNDFDYHETCGVGVAVNYPLAAEPSCTEICWQCVDEVKDSWPFNVATDTCGTAPAGSYPESEEPVSCEDITCWEDCEDGGESQDFDWDEVCGVGIAADYPQTSEPYCPLVPCWKDCQNGAEIEDFDYGTVCGVGDAVNYPEDSKPACAEYYNYSCSEYYYFLCTTSASCTANGANYYWANGNCYRMPSGHPWTFSTQLLALDHVNNQLGYIESNGQSMLRLMRFTQSFQTLFLFLILVGLTSVLFRNIFR